MADFTLFTGHLRASVDAQLARHLTVTGWQDGELRVHLDQPALATRWRFQEPMVRRALTRIPTFAGLRSIRLSTTHLPGRAQTVVSDAPSPALLAAPTDALRELAAGQTHPGLRAALENLANDAAQAQQRAASDNKSQN